jgi:hypothetical protein
MTTHNFDLTLHVEADGTTATLSDPGRWGEPLAEAEGATPDEAIAALFAKITVPMEEA